MKNLLVSFLFIPFMVYAETDISCKEKYEKAIDINVAARKSYREFLIKKIVDSNYSLAINVPEKVNRLYPLVPLLKEKDLCLQREEYLKMDQ
ncbi:MAG: hypothetical protein ACK5LE_08220 [Alphaproteobacteria bacterium]